jgi:hypothetical protein
MHGPLRATRTGGEIINMDEREYRVAKLVETTTAGVNTTMTSSDANAVNTGICLIHVSSFSSERDRLRQALKKWRNERNALFDIAGACSGFHCNSRFAFDSSARGLSEVDPI